MLSRLVITFLPSSECLLISWLQLQSAVILEPQKTKSDTVSTVSPSISHEEMGPDAMILVFWMLSFNSTFSLSSFTFIKRLFKTHEKENIQGKQIYSLHPEDKKCQKIKVRGLENWQKHKSRVTVIGLTEIKHKTIAGKGQTYILNLSPPVVCLYLII